MPQIIDTIRFLEWGKPAPANSEFKGVISTEKIFGTGNEGSYFAYTSRSIATESSGNEKITLTEDGFLGYTSRDYASGGSTFSSMGWLDQDKAEEFKAEGRKAFSEKGDLIWDAVIALNLRSYFVATQYAAKAMTGGGSIVNIASIGGLAACPMIASYGASKAAVISLTKTSGVELAPAGIRVNAILPGTIFSEMMPRDGEFTESTIAKIPMGRGGEPKEIGTAAAFLASDEASYVCGTTLIVDGGMTA